MARDGGRKKTVMGIISEYFQSGNLPLRLAIQSPGNSINDYASLGF